MRLVIFTLCLILAVSSARLEALSNPKVQKDLVLLGKIFDGLKKNPTKIQDMTVACALCGVVVNEVEGFLTENITQAQMVALLQRDICQPLGGGDPTIACDLLIDGLPYIIDAISNPNSISTICVELSLCTIPFPDGHPDMVPVPTFTIDLDQNPQDRWTHICSVPLYQQSTQYLYNTVKSILPDGGEALEILGEQFNLHYYPSDYAAEIRGCASALGIPFGWASLFQLGYEVSDACTSIVAEDRDGTIWHARNLDFGLGMAFSQTLKDMAVEVNFVKSGKPVFTATTFVGYVGVLSGMRPNGFSVTIDTRYYPQGFTQLFYEIIAAIEERNASLVAFLSRRTFEDVSTWPEALNALSNGELIADVYYTTAGVSSGQGAVISRNRTMAADVWLLDAPNRWFEVETNYDHWNQPPWFDNRRDPAIKHMTALGRTNLNMDNLFGILSDKPTLNLQSTYSIVAHPATSSYKTFTRYCDYPCVQ